jgi:hypothetical protein
VHCDITIFDWLMRWVKKDSLPENSWPKLGNYSLLLLLTSYIKLLCTNFLINTAFPSILLPHIMVQVFVYPVSCTLHLIESVIISKQTSKFLSFSCL